MPNLTKGKGLNKQPTFGKEPKAGKQYPNIELSDLCYMDADEVKKDEEYYSNNTIRNYFTTADKKEFKVYKVNNKLCYRRYGEYQPLKSGNYGFVVSPKGGLYAVHAPNWKANPAEIGTYEFFHSLLRAGQPVQTAGFLSYNAAEGQIEKIYRDSGHYKPSFKQHLRACLGLKNAGLLTNNTGIGKFSNVNPLTFKLGDIIEGRVDYRAIQDEAKPSVSSAPPPLPPRPKDHKINTPLNPESQQLASSVSSKHPLETGVHHEQASLHKHKLPIATGLTSQSLFAHKEKKISEENPQHVIDILDAGDELDELDTDVVIDIRDDENSKAAQDESEIDEPTGEFKGRYPL